MVVWRLHSRQSFVKVVVVKMGIFNDGYESPFYDGSSSVSSYQSSDSQSKMAVADPAFRAIPKNSSCFIIWRIEKLQLVLVPRDKYGTFYTGDSYVVLSICEVGSSGGGTHVKVKEAKRALDVHIHFWLGKNTSQDEAGVAAYKTVELDDHLGGTPVQHREVQGHESKRFIAYFKDGIRLLEGGVASGLHHVIDTFEPKMYLVKGKRKPFVRQLASMSWDVMNDSDVFLLDTKHVIIVWVGKRANHMEKLQGAKAAQKLKSEHGLGTNILIVDDGQESELPRLEKEYFNRFLPLQSKKLKHPPDPDSDDIMEKRHYHDLKLYRCSDESGTLKVTETKSKPLQQWDLQSSDSYIVDNSQNGIWVWVGKRASQKERSEAMRNAQGFLKKKGYPNHVQVTRVIDGGEPLEFKALFENWRENNVIFGVGRPSVRGIIAKTVQMKFDVTTLHENAGLAAQTQMIDDGSGKTQVWQVQKSELVPQPANQLGRFTSRDCYVIKYNYNNGVSDACLIYYWMGTRSTAEGRAVVTNKSAELDVKGDAVLVKVVQGREPPHLMAVFGGKLVILDGTLSETYLLQVRGMSPMNTRAVQVEMRAASLNSNDVFVLFGRSQVYIWAGRGSTGDEREMAKLVAADSPRELVMVYEGQEKEDFWEAIGGKEIYAGDKRSQDAGSYHVARLFRCSNASGGLKVEEIIDFEQSDLVEDDIMLLDSWEAMFVWLGGRANSEEKLLAEKTADQYLRTDPSGRDYNTPIYRIKEGFEPPIFTGFFGGWDSNFWSKAKTFEQLKNEIIEDNPGISVILPHSNGPSYPIDVPKFDLEALAGKDPEQLPEGVDPSRKEIHLADVVFEKVFSMKLDEFETLPQWKKVALKKKVGLF